MNRWTDSGKPIPYPTGTVEPPEPRNRSSELPEALETKWGRKVGVRIGLIVGLTAVCVLASHSAGSLTVPNPTIVFGAPGSVHELGHEAVDPSNVGQTCAASITASNNESIREGSDLIVTSDGSTVTLPNVEATPNIDIHTTATLVLGTTLVVSVRLGPEGAFSGGGAVVLTCTPPVPVAPPAPVVEAPPHFTG